MLMAVIAICFVLLAIGQIIIHFVYPFENALLYASGMTLGCVHSLIKVVLLEKSISRTIDMDNKGAENIARLHYFGRFALTAAVFACVFLFPGLFGLFGTIIGVVSLQLAAYITNFILK